MHSFALFTINQANKKKCCGTFVPKKLNNAE